MHKKYMLYRQKNTCYRQCSLCVNASVSSSRIVIAIVETVAMPYTIGVYFTTHVLFVQFR